eukprot:6466578-Amphidinium_carterae.1
MQKAPTRQAPPLKVEHLRQLEELVTSAPSLQDRVAAGYMCFCLMASARFSDGQELEVLKFDIDEEGVGVVYGETVRHKTSRVITARRKLLPLMALSVGVSGTSWAKGWAMARRESGLGSDTRFTLPAPDGSGGWQERKLSTAE